ncbi:MAG TPA: LuxR C-terminal-related transcriptional regulator [Acidimicrobiales bacterium]
MAEVEEKTSPTPSSLEDLVARIDRLEVDVARIAAEVERRGAEISEVRRLADMAHLTPRQSEVLIRILSGQRVGRIAADLYVSRSTVRNHLSGIYQKLGVGSQSELIEFVRSKASWKS